MAGAFDSLFSSVQVDSPLHLTEQLSFRPRIHEKRSGVPVKLFTLSEFRSTVCEGFGRSSTTWLETVTCDSIVKPYFDWEEYVAAEPPPAVLSNFYSDLKRELVTLFDASSDEFLACATRHGWVTKRDGSQPFKISFRFYATGYKMQVKDLGRMVKDSTVLSERWDTGVYPANVQAGEQLLGCIGCCKGLSKGGVADTRVLLPIDASHSFADYVAQALYGDEVMLEHTTPCSPPAPRRQRVQLRSSQPRWLHLEPFDMKVKARDAVMAAGMVGGYDVGEVQTNLVKFVTTGERNCMHGTTHTSNSFSVSFAQNGSLFYHCTSPRCKDIPPPVIGDPWRSATSSVEFPAWDELEPHQRQRFSCLLTSQLEQAVWAADPMAKKFHKCNDYAAFNQWARDYCNHFFAHIRCSKPEIVQMDFNETGEMVCHCVTMSLRHHVVMSLAWEGYIIFS